MLEDILLFAGLLGLVASIGIRVCLLHQGKKDKHGAQRPTKR